MELTAIRKQARTAGLLYLTVAVTAPIGVTYVPGKLLVPGDFTATADRIRASASLIGGARPTDPAAMERPRQQLRDRPGVG